MDIRADKQLLELTSITDAELSIQALPGGGLEVYVYNGLPYDDNQYGCATFSPKDAPDVLVAIQAWIEGLCDEH